MVHQFTFILLIYLLLPATSLTAVAQNRPGPPEPPAQMVPEPPQQMRSARMLSGQEIPGLTEEQREKIQMLRLEARQGETDLENRIREMRAGLRTATTGSTVDMDEAESIIEDIAGLEAELMKLQVNTRNDIRNLLTDEQNIVFDTRAGNELFAGRRGRVSESPRGPQIEYRVQGPRFRLLRPDMSPSGRRGVMPPPPPSQPPPPPQSP